MITAGMPATVIDSNITVSDVDNTSLYNATIRIASGFVGSEDELGFTNQHGISGSYDSIIVGGN